MSNLLAAVKARAAEVTDVHIEVVGRLAEAPPRFSAVDLHVTANSPDTQTLEHLITLADRGCIMMNTLRATLDLRIRVGAAV